MASWREAFSLARLLEQVNVLWPHRSKASDGEIGDLAHQHEKSDHNPNAHGVVQAIDITNDPVNGIASRKLAEKLVESRDPRIKYIISDGEICSATVAPWAWRKYHGKNGHFHHVHISVKDDPAFYDNPADWLQTGIRTLKKGDIGKDVEALQRVLKLKPDGLFGDMTEKAVRAVQVAHGLREDGIVGQQTRNALGM
jgi:peptidoglycan hydrolase-like protein with peptidoglycan-binding domain